MSVRENERKREPMDGRRECMRDNVRTKEKEHVRKQMKRRVHNKKMISIASLSIDSSIINQNL